MTNPLDNIKEKDWINYSVPSQQCNLNKDIMKEKSKIGKRRVGWWLPISTLDKLQVYANRNVVHRDNVTSAVVEIIENSKEIKGLK